jgi:hypothetical protein
MARRLANFRAQYESFIEESTADCAELGLDPRKLVKVEIDTASVEAVRTEDNQKIASQVLSTAHAQADINAFTDQIGTLREELDGPNVRYQIYLQELHEWEERRTELTGDVDRPGTIAYLNKQLADLNLIPELLQKTKKSREEKTQEIYSEISKVVDTYKELYRPVQEFIEHHALASGRFKLDFEASIICAELEESFFNLINQGRKGSFAGVEEGRKQLKRLIDLADFGSAEGATKFAADLLGLLLLDGKENPPKQMTIGEQVKKDVPEQSVLDLIFSLNYLVPKYSLRWSGKELDELSPGERGTLLLIFYLLIDRRDVPLFLLLSISQKRTSITRLYMALSCLALEKLGNAVK